MSAAVAVKTGQFVWRDLMTTDPDKAIAFYNGLFGWGSDVMPMGEMGDYTMLRNGEKHFGGVNKLDPSHGHPSHWISYITVENVDQATAKAAELGGNVAVPGMDIPNVGRFAVVIDPQGAAFSPFEDHGGQEESAEPDGMPPIGGVSWNELMTADFAGAKDFYGQIFGWTYGKMPFMEGYDTYAVCMRGDTMAGGIGQKPDEVPASLWVIYFLTGDLDQTLEDVTRFGGHAAGPIIEVPTVGRVCWAMDPTGALFGLHEPPK